MSIVSVPYTVGTYNQPQRVPAALLASLSSRFACTSKQNLQQVTLQQVTLQQVTLHIN